LRALGLLLVLLGVPFAVEAMGEPFSLFATLAFLSCFSFAIADPLLKLCGVKRVYFELYIMFEFSACSEITNQITTTTQTGIQ
jgi:hypothetical protein